MAKMLTKIKLMPDSPNTDLNKLEKEALEKIKKNPIDDIKVEKEPIAFGLTALIITIVLDESLSPDLITEELTKIRDVNNAEIIDIRRAIG